MLCHDPRISNDRSEKRETENAVLIWAEHQRQAFPNRDIDWDEIARSADYLDWPVDPRTGNAIFGG
jgi:hypothetical protein